MRKLLVYILTALTVCSCEVIDEADRLIPLSPTHSSGRVHVLLEYTGCLCVNCPTAAQRAQELQELYGEQLMVIALHPATNHFTHSLYDYTCPEADSIYLSMGGTETTPFPKGNIDFLPMENEYLLDLNRWATQLNNVMPDTVHPYVSAKAEYDSVNRSIAVTTILYAEQALDAQLMTWLVEDSVTGAQMMPDGSVNTAYIHRHMLRASADATAWGTAVHIIPTTQQQTCVMPLPAACRPKHCRIVTLLVDTHDHHLLQAYETTLDFGARP